MIGTFNTPSGLILPLIVLSQFCCTSLWFAGNAVLPDLISAYDLPDTALSFITSSVQLGFIIGTLCFALLTISDRFSPSVVFFACALIGALFNLGMIWQGNNLFSILGFRFFTGVLLAGVYPVGMKIASDYYEKGLGKALGYLVGALVMGTAFPHLLKELGSGFPWKNLIISISALSTFGGAMILIFVPDGPYRKVSLSFDASAIQAIFKERSLRSAAFGYFGHMWELYTFWAFVPVMLLQFADKNDLQFKTPFLSFLIIAAGGLGCVFGGYLAQKKGEKRTAILALLVSGICCLSYPLVFTTDNEALFLTYLFVWGVSVVADSPMLSTLVANNAPKELKGTALTVVNSIGFFITIISIQLVSALISITSSSLVFMILAIGPLMGILALKRESQAAQAD